MNDGPRSPTPADRNRAERLLPPLDLRPVVVETSFTPEDLEGLLDLPTGRGVFHMLCRAEAHGEEPWVVTGADPLVRVSARRTRARVEGREGGVRAATLHPLALVDALARILPERRPALVPPFPGGALGYLGYGLRTCIEDVPDRRPPDTPLPDLHFMVPDRFWTWPSVGGKVLAVAWVPPGTSRRLTARRLRERASLPRGRGAAATPAARSASSRSNFTRAGYLRAVRRVLAYIRAGDVYQANLTQRFRAPLTRPPGEIFRTLCAINPAPFAAYLSLREGAVLSASPERFLRLDGRRVLTEPIKGTRPRGRDARADRALAEALRTSAKDRAELAIIVDLERNDLGRVCRFGTVKVAEPCRLETHPTVHHLVAAVTGELRRGVRLSEVLAATFPGGSVTGAPKIRAMEVLDELEPTARGVYTGALGTIGCDGRVDLSLCIRILVAARGRIVYPVGGGIVIDSNPEGEYRETLVKAAAQARAVALT